MIDSSLFLLPKLIRLSILISSTKTSYVRVTRLVFGPNANRKGNRHLCYLTVRQAQSNVPCFSSGMQICVQLPNSNWWIQKWEWMCLHFDVRAGAGAWEYSPQTRGGGVPQGIRLGCFNWTFLFMIPASPLWIQPKAARETNSFPPGGRTTVRGVGIHYWEQASGNTQILRAYCIIQHC